MQFSFPFRINIHPHGSVATTMRWKWRWKHWWLVVLLFTILAFVQQPGLVVVTVQTIPTTTTTTTTASQPSFEESLHPSTTISNCSSTEHSGVLPLLPPTLYVCGFDLWNFARNLFPDFNYGGRLVDPRTTTSSSGSTTINGCPLLQQQQQQQHDVLVQGGLDGPCEVPPTIVQEFFRGKILYVNSEPRTGGSAEKHRLSDRFFQIGPTEYPNEPRTLPVLFGAIVWSATTTPQQRAIFLEDRTTRQHTTTTTNHRRRRQAVIFLVSNCLPMRREAATRISEILRVDHGPKCGPTTSQPDRHGTIPMAEHHGRGSYIHNPILYSNYQFCLVMENTATPGYITEKIFLAYLGGCIPIYWGTRQIFDVFHHDSFIFYDIDNPQSALDEIKLLASNETAYHAKLQAPILLNGTTTWRNYLSLVDDDVVDEDNHNDDDGSVGSLKQRIRDMMGIRMVEPHEAPSV